MYTKGLYITLFIGVSLILGVLPIGAQDNGIPACTQDDTLALVEASGPIAELIELSESHLEQVSASPQVEQLLSALLDYDELQTRWWSQIAPSLPRCPEFASLKILFGRTLAEIIISFGMTYLSVTETELGESATGETFADLAMVHAREYTELSNAIFDNIMQVTEPENSVSIPTCAQDQVLDSLEDFNQINAEFEDISGGLPTVEGVFESTELLALIIEIEELQFRWWTELVPSFPRCAELVDISLQFGRLLDETLIFLLISEAFLNQIAIGDSDEIESFMVDRVSYHGDQIDSLTEEVENTTELLVAVANGEAVVQTPQAEVTTSVVESVIICTVTVSRDVNLRGGPGTVYAIEGTLSVGQSADVDGQATGDDGSVWWQLTNGSWVRADVVNERGDCESIPEVETP